MTTPLEEHDYIGLSVTPPMASSSNVAVVSSPAKGLNLKATELRLGLPGTESPERDIDLFKGFVSGAKRGHSDSINSRSGKWVFSGGDGSELDLGKHAGIFSPKGVNGGGCESEYQTEVIPLSPKPVTEKKSPISAVNGHGSTSSAKAQVVGWPPIRSNRKISMVTSVYVKVGMDGAPYLRKVDLKIYSNYTELSLALEKMFSCFKIGECDSDGVSSCEGLTTGSLKDSEYMLTYEDKDGDWMLVGDVPWAMFMNTCRRMRIMKRSDANGLGAGDEEKCKNRG